MGLNPELSKSVLGIRRRIRMFFGLPDPLVTSTDPAKDPAKDPAPDSAPDPSIIKQKL